MSMKASIVSAPGAAPALGDAPKPTAGPGEILVKNHAASINPVDWKMGGGTWWGVGGLMWDRISDAEFPWIFGGDGAGVVEAVGEGVREFKVGDEVFFSHEIFKRTSFSLTISGGGSYAQYSAVPVGMAALKPKEWTFEEAAAVPLTGQTALAMMRRANLALGEFVVVNGASGGVGSMAVQLAVAAGAFVVGICSEASAERVRRLGAHAVIDYRKLTAEHNYSHAVLAATGGQRVDVWLDCVTTAGHQGGNPLSYVEISRCMAHRGRISVCDTKPATEGGLGSPYLELTLLETFVRFGAANLRTLANLGRIGRFKAEIDSVFPLADVAASDRKGAWDRSKSARAQGKIVIKIE